jgi:phage/plasmid-like protein (TIGR03299 family)
MPALVESMYSTREKPWHGLGIVVKEAPTSENALHLAGLDWNVIQEPIYTPFREKIEGFKANVRDTDRKVLGVVSDRYKVVQNVEAFSFTDELLGNGVRYETAGSLSEGRRVWMLARLPREYIIAGERISPYLVFSNTHDGSGSVKVAITPVRVVCNNTLNLALNTAQRSFSMIHTGNIADKIQEARDTLFMAESYMDQLGAEFEQLRKQKISDEQVKEFIELLLPMEKNPTKTQVKNIIRLRDDMTRRYYEAPDLQGIGNNAYRFINAVSDFATHADPLRRTANYSENLFSRTVDGNPLIDRGYQLIKAAA